MDGLKICRKCAKELPGDAFPRHRAVCWECKRAAERARYREDAPYREAKLAASRRWQQENRERYLERMRNYHAAKLDAEAIAVRDARAEREALRGSGKRRCLDCGEVRPLSQFSVRSELADGRTSVCRPCERARDRARERAWQEATLPGAHNRGKEWTGPELEMVARDDLSAVEVALALNRTWAGVTMQRKLMGIDPRKARLAGLDTATADRARP